MSLIKEKLREVLSSLLPLIIVICIMQFTLIKAPTEIFLQFVIGCIFAIAGLIFFFVGIELGIIPMGRYIGAELPKRRSLWLIGATAFLFGFAVTVAEPDVLVLSGQVGKISDGSISQNSILYIIAIGVGIFVCMAMLRIVFGFKMVYLLAISYTTVVILSFVTPTEYIPMAYDAGSVTTGALTTPVVISLALGLSSVLSGRSALSDGFGLLGFASIGPIIAIMIMGIVSR